jgi:c(7)-type cytochrome triheme protein
MLVLILVVAVAFVGSAMAVPPGKTVEYPAGDQGKVIFSGDTHGMKQGMKCADCHPKPFAMKKGAFKMTKEDHGKPDFCGKCHDGKEHNGKVVFSQSAEADCAKCHKKAEAPVAPAAPAPAPEAPAAPAAPAPAPEAPVPAK